MSVVSFERWREIQRIALPRDELVECPSCNGEGEDECCCCGQASECEACCGNGQLEYGEMDEAVVDLYFTQAKYIEAVTSDIEALASWKGVDKIPIFLEAGFTVYCALNKTEVVAIQ